MQLCSSCGTENQENSKFCLNCGSSLEIQSSIVSVRKTGEAVSAPLSSREERFRKAKVIALKAIKDQEKEESKRQSSVVYIGEKIL